MCVGEPSNGSSLRIARAKHARALAYLAHSSRPNKVGDCSLCHPAAVQIHNLVYPELPSLSVLSDGKHS